MTSVKELLQKVQLLNYSKEYQEVIDSLPDSVLESYGDADLYAEKAIASYKLKAFVHCEILTIKSLIINPSHGKANIYKAKLLYDDKKYEEAILCFKKALETIPDYDGAYIGLGNVYLDREEYSAAMECFNEAIRVNPNSAPAHNGIGNVNLDLEKYDVAVEHFTKALNISPEWTYYHNLGVAYRDQSEYQKSIEHFQKALKLERNETDIYSEFASVYLEMGQYTDAIYYCNKALELDPENDAAVFNRALAYFKLKQYKNALLNYQLFIELTKDSYDFFTETAISKVEELNRILQDDTYTNVSELVNKVKKHLLFTDDCVTHYTSLSVAKALILDESKFRLSEGTFLNDTSEGRELFNYLSLYIRPLNGSDVIAQPFTPKPFIGSFVSENKHDDLTLWRMYGKEDKEEARGCAITIYKDNFLKSLKAAISPDNKKNNQLNTDLEFEFYRVAYRKPNSDYFIIPGANEEEDELNEYMREMHDEIKNINQENEIGMQNIFELLNEIAFLFKSIEYQYEHEVRLVIKGVGFEKVILKDVVPPRVYIELVSVNSVIKEITLGPKVVSADEWASAFFYNLGKKHKNPQILISHLPFK